MYRLSKNSAIAAVILMLMIILLIPATVFSQTKAEPKQIVAAVDPDFAYYSKERRDPFEPLYLAKVKQRQANGIQKREGYELEELKLVGVLRSGAAKFAMMEDTHGKGILFKEGDPVNKNTWLMDVGDEKITMAYRVKGDIRKIAIDIPHK